MEGVDLITEGILTLTETLECLEEGNLDIDNAAGKLIKFLLDSDCINFMVGAKLNQAHYNPALPIENRNTQKYNQENGFRFAG